MIKDKKVIMMIAGDTAISYKKTKPAASVDEILNHVMKTIISKKDIKIFGIAAATYALNYLNNNPNSTERKVMQSLVNESNHIIASIEEQDNNTEVLSDIEIKNEAYE